MEKITLTENGIPSLSNSMMTGHVDENGVIVQISSVAQQSNPTKKMYKCSINDMRFKMNAIFIHNENQDLDNNDVVKIDSIFVKQGTTSSLLIIKKYQILAKQMQPIARGFLETFTQDMISNQSNTININNVNNQNNNNNNLNQNNNNRNYNNNNYEQGNNNNNQNQYNSNNFNNNNSRGGFNSSGSRGNSNYLPLSAVSSFTKEIFMKVRVTKKFEKKTFGSGQKQGMVFSFNIIDEEGTEFPCCGFNKACENFYDRLNEGKVYEISGGYVKLNDKKWTNIKSEYKYFLDDKTVITELEDDESISHLNFSFKKLDSLVEMPQYSLVDVLAYVLKCNDLMQVKTRKGDGRDMRKIYLADDTGHKIEATIWGKLCQMTINEGTVYAFKNLKLGEYNRNKNLTIGDDSSIIEQDNKEALDMQLFCSQQKEFKDVSTTPNEDKDSLAGYVPQNLRFIKDLIEMLDRVEDENAKLKSYKVKAVISGLTLNNDKFYYEGCPGCKKKMQANENGEYYCNSCTKAFEKPLLYYTLNFKIKDITGEIYVDVLGQIGQRVFGKTAEEIRELLDQRDEEKLKKIISDSDYAQYYFLISPKLHTYNDVRRKRFSVIRIDPVETVPETNRIIQEISKYC